MTTATTASHRSRPARAGTAIPTIVRIGVSAAAAVCLGVAGLRWCFGSADALDRVILGLGTDLASPAERWAGVAALAAAQVVVIGGVVWAVFPRRALDTLVVQAAAGGSVLAAFAAVVLATTGR